jgi:hypothetical protein
MPMISIVLRMLDDSRPIAWFVRLIGSAGFLLLEAPGYLCDPDDMNMIGEDCADRPYSGDESFCQREGEFNPED